jgi:hypothetical protein
VKWGDCGTVSSCWTGSAGGGCASALAEGTWYRSGVFFAHCCTCCAMGMNGSLALASVTPFRSENLKGRGRVVLLAGAGSGALLALRRIIPCLAACGVLGWPWSLASSCATSLERRRLSVLKANSCGTVSGLADRTGTYSLLAFSCVGGDRKRKWVSGCVGAWVGKREWEMRANLLEGRLRLLQPPVRLLLHFLDLHDQKNVSSCEEKLKTHTHTHTHTSTPSQQQSPQTTCVRARSYARAS